MLKLTVKLKDSEAQIQEKIVSALCRILNKELASADMRNTTTARIVSILGDAIRSQPEYLSLTNLSGQLRTELGIEDISVVNDIVDVWLSSVRTIVSSFRPGAGGLTGYVKVVAIPSSYHDVLSSAYASYTSEKGVEINWLRWLLLKGDEIIIADHRIFYNPKYSRTGSDIMVAGSGWRVPPQFSGTAENNWITRAIDQVAPDIVDIIIDEIRRRLMQ